LAGAIDGWLNNATGVQLATAQKELWALLAECPELLPVVASFSLVQVHQAIQAARTTKSTGKVLLIG